MFKNIRVKEAFTLMELMIVILIISISYLLIFSKSNFSIKNEESKINLKNLNTYLLKNYSFEDKLSFVCIDDELACFIKIDKEVIKESKIKNFFKFTPEVFDFKNIDKKIEFEEITIDNISFDVIFKYEINKDFKSNEFIVDTLDDSIYEFNSLYKEALVYDTKNEIEEKRLKNKQELKDAF